MVQDKLDVVKTVMRDNIQQILLNDEKLERIDASAEQLNEQSQAFKSNTKALTNKMFWKMWKMRILIGGLIIAILIIIIVPIAVTSSQSSSSNGN
jgi:vesicle-associated membrane protein 72